ncbi:SAM hydrolase/SAM-dependent halogenase family protein [Flavobacterium sp. TSSA_36]|jgi:S-adenosylmethionine hydrolase|uniref:SAM hydrolase/SAM-dependent halogenase family protein n=1 Tax=Flavobacterium sp. TSSA_36 TaxID=3447669 RepID=UPI003F3DE294
MSIITLTTDYGLKDYFVGALKGKLLTINPECKVVDISHDIDPFNIVEASYILNAAYSSFPKGTVHLIGVDIELTKENQHIAIEWNDHFFIAADNGILSMLCQKIIPQKMVAINIHDRLHEGATDLEVFVQVASHLANGGSLNVIGKEIISIKEVTEMKVNLNDQGNQLSGCVIYIDHFGNVVSNITKKHFIEAGKGRSFEILLKSKSIKSIVPKYSAIATSNKFPPKYFEGDKLALFNEAGYLEIAIYRSNPSKVGSAHSLLGLNYRDPITVIFT